MLKIENLTNRINLPFWQHNRLWIVLVSFIIFHVILVFRYFPVDSVMSGNFLCSDDLRFHFASALEGHDFFPKQHQIWGYSPNYMGGYPFGLWGSMSRRGYEIISVILPGLPFHLAYYISIVWLALLTPLVVALAFKILGFGWKETAVSALLSILVYQFDNTFYWQKGSIMFPFVTALSIVYAALLHVGCCRRSLLHYISAGLIAGVIAWLHQLVFLNVLISTVLILWLDRKFILKGFNWILPIIAFVVGLLVILPWAIVLLKFLYLRHPVETHVYQSGLRHLVMDVFSDRRYQYPFDRRTLTHVIWVLAFLGTFLECEKHKPNIFVFWVTSVGLFICSYAFSYSSFLKQLEPYHFLQSCLMFATIPATVGVFKFHELLKILNKAGKIISICLFLMLMPCLTAYLIDVTQLQQMKGLSREQKQTIDFLASKSNIPGRILCQDEILSGAIQYFTGRELIGGSLSTWALMPHKWANVDQETAFGIPIENLSQEKLNNYLLLFNIEFVIADSENFKRKIEGLNAVCKKTAQFGNLQIYAIDPSRLGWIWNLQSSADVRAEPNQIMIDNAPSGQFVLKYHYLKTLSAIAGVNIYPVFLLDDPVPFIGIDNLQGFNRIEIYNASNK